MRRIQLALLVLGSALNACFLNTQGIGSGGAGGTGGESSTSTSGSGGKGGDSSGTTTSTGGTGGVGGASSSTGGSGGTGGGNTVCADGDVQSCYSGLPATKGVGTCKAGQQTCANNAWGPCQGEVLPEAVDVTCDGLDTDCDGVDDSAAGCASFEVSDTCQGVMLLSGGSVIVPAGSSPDNAACFNGTVKWFVNPGDTLYILEDDNASTVKIWGIDPMAVNAKAQANGAKFDHASMLVQYQTGGFTTVGLTQTVVPISGGNEYQLDRTGAALRQSFVFSF